MEIERGTADREQERAFQHPDVVAIADRVLAHPRDPRILSIARQAVVSVVPATREELRAELGPTTDEALLDDAEAIARHGANIENHPNEGDKGRRKGAVLERIVFGLLSAHRRGEVTRESKVRLSVNRHCGDAMSGRKDSVVDAPVFEVYECKWATGVEQWEIYQLADIYLTALADKPTTTRAYTALVTMASDVAIRSRVGRLDLPEVLYFAERARICDLADRPASNKASVKRQGSQRPRS